MSKCDEIMEQYHAICSGEGRQPTKLHISHEDWHAVLHETAPHMMDAGPERSLYELAVTLRHTPGFDVT